MNFVAILHFTSLTAYVLLLVYVLSRRSGSPLNLFCSFLIFSIALFSLSYGLLNLGPDQTTSNWYIDTQNRACYVSCHFSNDTNGEGMQHSGISYDGASPFILRARILRGRAR